MNKEKLWEMFKEKLGTLEYQDKEKILGEIRKRYTDREEEYMKRWTETKFILSSLIKVNAPFATIIDLSGIIFFPNRELNIVYTTSIVVNRNYLNNVLHKPLDIEHYMSTYWIDEKVLIVRVQINKRSLDNRYKIGKYLHLYVCMQYKDFFQEVTFNNLVERKMKGTKY